MRINNPVFRIKAEDKPSEHKYTKDKFCGLEKELYLAIGSRVYLNNNIAVKLGLFNSCMGTVVKLIFDETKSTNSVPDYAVIDLDHCNIPEDKCF